MAIVWGFFTCLASFLLFNFFNVLLQTVIALENVCDHLYVKLNTWIFCGDMPNSFVLIYL